MPVDAVFCGSCGITRNQALGVDPIPAERVIGATHPIYAENAAAATEASVSTPQSSETSGISFGGPPTEGTSEVADDQLSAEPRRRTFTRDEVEQKRIEDARLRQEREAIALKERVEREREEREREERERQEREAREEREREEQRERARLASEERERMLNERRQAAERAARQQLARKDRTLRRLFPLALLGTVVGVLCIGFAIVQNGMFANATPQDVVAAYCRAVVTRDVGALKADARLFPHTERTLEVLPTKYSKWSAADDGIWNAEIRWNNWRGTGQATLSMGGHSFDVAIGSRTETVNGIFRKRVWFISSPAPTVRFTTAWPSSKAPLAINGVDLGPINGELAKQVLGIDLFALPGEYKLSTTGLGTTPAKQITVFVEGSGNSVTTLA